MSTLIDKFGREITVVRAGGRTEASWAGASFAVDRDLADADILARADGHWPAGVPVVIETSYREDRAAAYFMELRVEETDDRITVIGDTLDKVITQLETVRVALSAPATAEWTALLAALMRVKSAIPKKPLPRPVSR